MGQLKNKNILVTGATGFLGYYIIQELFTNSEASLVVLKRTSSEYQQLRPFESRISYIDGDLNDIFPLLQLLDNIDIVIHAAASLASSADSFEKLYNDNVEATKNLVDLSLMCNIEKFIFVSSASVFGKSELHAITETSDDYPTKSKPYAHTKYLSELEVWRGYNEGLNISIINPTQILGAGNWSYSSPKMIHTIGQGHKKYPSGSNGFVDVRDVAKMIHLAINNTKSGSQFLCTGHNSTYLDIIKSLCNKLKIVTPSSPISKGDITFARIISFLNRFLPMKKSGFGIENLVKSTKKVTYSNAKSCSQFEMQYTPLDDTLQDISEAYQMAIKNELSPTYLSI